MKERTIFSQIRTLFNIEGNHGFTDAEMQPFFSVVERMPTLLYEYYTTLGKHQALNQTQDSLVIPTDNLRLFQHPDKFVFYVENQNCCQWAIAKEDLGEENPKVHMSTDIIHKHWQMECETLSEFLLAMAHLQAVFALPYAYEGFKSITPEELTMIKTHFPKKPFALHHWLEGVEFYGGATDSIVIMDGGSQLIYASSSESSFEAMNNFFENIGEEM
ncbi:MAG: hypothetical protein Q3983_05140 [Capnocytophaga sp.]|nr:hypothetical protein [Capnocytophaga sp.]